MLTYQEYKELGFDSVTETQFPKLEMEAVYYLEYATLNKVNQEHTENVQNKVDYALCRVIDLLHDYHEKSQSIKDSDKEIISSGLKSESIKSHSVSFRDAVSESQSELLKGTEQIIYTTIKRILLPTGLLYRGL